MKNITLFTLFARLSLAKKIDKRKTTVINKTQHLVREIIRVFFVNPSK